MPSFGGYSLLHYVCASGNVDIFDCILARLSIIYGGLNKPLLDQENQSKETPLHWAVLKNNYQLVKRLIQEHRKIAEANSMHQQSQLDDQ
jgi:ankyrin repeat protein